MNAKPLLVYDCEIVKAIPSRNEEEVPGIEYCGGWRDFSNMGISVVCAYDYKTKQFRVFLEDNFAELDALFRERTAAAFNGRAFDDCLVAAHGMSVADVYDPLQAIWHGAGLGPTFDPRTHGGYGLDAVCEANFGIRKSGNGALAPIWWQQGKRGQVIDYCMNDVFMEKTLVDHIVEHGSICCPKTGRALTVPRPGDVW